MLLSAILITIGLLCTLLGTKVTLIFTKREQTKLTLLIAGFKFNPKKKNRKNNKRNSQKKRRPPSLRTILRITKLLRGCEITVRELTVPVKEKDFSETSFLEPYRRKAFICAILSFVDSTVKKLNVLPDTIFFSKSSDTLCLDITLKFRLFYLILAYITYVSSSIREKKTKKGYVYVR